MRKNRSNVKRNLNALEIPDGMSPSGIAEKFLSEPNSSIIQEGCLTLALYQGGLWRYEEPVWKEIAKDFIDPYFNDLLRTYVIALKEEKDGIHKQKYVPEPSKVRHFRQALFGQLLKRQPQELNSWLSDTPRALAQFPKDEVVQVANGVFHLPLRKMVSGPTPWWFGTSPLPWEYDARATCPNWEKFILETFGEDQVKTAQQMSGALLAPHNRWQKLFWLLGAPRTGKGVFQSVNRIMVGSHNHSETSLRRINATSKGNAHLIGKRFITLSEAGQVSLSDIRSATGFLQKATGGDTVEIPRMNQDDWVGTMPAKFWVSSNTIPDNLDDASGALFERSVVLVTMRDTIPEEERDYDLADNLLKELPGIVNWALEGLAELEKPENRGFHQSQAAKLRKMEITDNPFQDFADDKMEVNPKAWEFRTEVVEVARTWFESQNLRAPTAKKLWARLKGIYPQIDLDAPRQYDHSTSTMERVVWGITLRHKIPREYQQTHSGTSRHFADADVSGHKTHANGGSQGWGMA